MILRLLIDSHVALWWLANDRLLGATARSTIDQSDEAFFSVVTPWELGIKQALAKIAMPDGLSQELELAGFQPLGISIEHAELAPRLPLHHRDPFDRMLIAQAQLESLTILSADQQLAAYDVPQIDARSKGGDRVECLSYLWPQSRYMSS